MSERRWNDLQWHGQPGHYEVYYLTFTDPATGVGFWIRYTMVAPLPETGEEADLLALALAMDPADPARERGREGQLPGRRADGRARIPFRLAVGDAWLSDDGMGGSIEHGRPQCGLGAPVGARASGLRTRAPAPARARRSPRRSSSCRTPTSRSAARSSSASRAHRADGRARGAGAPVGLQARDALGVGALQRLHGPDGEPRHGRLRRRGQRVRAALRPRARPEHARRRARRRTGPALDQPAARCSEPERLRPRPAGGSRRGARRRRLEGRSARASEDLVGVTYHDPDGELAYCYNTEVADMRLDVFERARRGWMAADGRAARGRPRPLRVRAARADRRRRAEDRVTAEPPACTGVAAPFAWRDARRASRSLEAACPAHARPSAPASAA